MERSFGVALAFLKKKAPRMAAVVTAEKCNGCGNCVDACAQKAITVGNIATVDFRKCIGCGFCVAECPNEAISVLEFKEAAS